MATLCIYFIVEFGMVLRHFVASGNTKEKETGLENGACGVLNFYLRIIFI